MDFTSNPLYVLLYVLSILGLTIWISEKLSKTQYGKPLGTAIITILLGALAANAGMLTGTYTGGSLNFNAVGTYLGFMVAGWL